MNFISQPFGAGFFFVVELLDGPMGIKGRNSLEVPYETNDSRTSTGASSQIPQ